MEMFRRTYSEVNLENLRHNWQQVKSIGGGNRFICPMVKANAYGHGDIQVAETLVQEGAEALGVCLVEEGLKLSTRGLSADILVFRGFDRRGAEAIIDNQLVPVVSQWAHLEALESVASDPVKVHVKFNTGMARLGFEPQESEKLFDFFKKSKKLKLKALATHLAIGDDATSEAGASQQQFKKMLEIESFFKPLNVYSHVLNSSGIISLAWMKKNKPDSLLAQQPNWGFRPGIMLYGCHTMAENNLTDLKQVMSLRSVVDSVRKIGAGETVSYGGTWTSSQPSFIGVVPIGYADGVHRLVSNRAAVRVNGQLCPIAGRVCMDFFMIDMTELIGTKEASSFVGAEVTLFGYDHEGQLLSADEWADQAETINYEILTSVSARVPRQYKGITKP